MQRNIALTIGFVVLVLLGGCVGGLDGDDGGEQDPTEYVPSDVGMVAHVDSVVAEDADSTSLLSELMEREEFGSGVEDPESAQDEFENQTGLDPTAISDVTYFIQNSEMGTATGGEAFIVYADWETDDVVSSFEDEMDVEYEEEERDGVTVYSPSESDERPANAADSFAVPEDGVFIAGSDDGLDAAIAVANGDDDGISDEMQTAFDRASGGFATLALDASEEEFETDPGLEQQDIDTSQLNAVDTVGVTYDVSDGTISAEAHLHAGGDSDAESVHDVLEGVLSLYRNELPEDQEDLHAQLDNIETTQDGSVVEVTYEADADDLADFIESLGPQQLPV